MQDILAGLQHSHDRGIIHGDIEPASIMLTNDGHAKIADFGIARIEHSGTAQVGMTKGTPAYMSPEQLKGETVGPSTDIYSAGVVLYQLLTGERPFDGDLATIGHKVLSTEPPRPSDISRVAPRSVDGVVARAMAKHPDRRFDEAKVFALALNDALAIKTVDPSIRSIAARKVPGPSRRAATRSYLYPVAGTFLLTLAAAGYWMVVPGAASRTDDSRRPTPPRAAGQANDAAVPANFGAATSSPTPRVTPTEPPAPREALSAPFVPAEAPPQSMPSQPSGEPTAVPMPYPVPQPAPSSSTSSAPANFDILPRLARREGRNPLLHQSSKPAAGPRTDLNSASRPSPWASSIDDIRAGRRPRDTPDEAAMTRMPANDTSNSAQAFTWERDSLSAAAPLGIAAAPKFIGRMGMVNGRLTFVPAAPDPAK